VPAPEKKRGIRFISEKTRGEVATENKALLGKMCKSQHAQAGKSYRLSLSRRGAGGREKVIAGVTWKSGKAIGSGIGGTRRLANEFWGLRGKGISSEHFPVTLT